MKTVEEVYNEIIAYINGEKHNRPCTLASIKKALRTPEIINLIFSRPDIFHLNTEIKHVPDEYLTDELLVKYILKYPKEFESLDEPKQTLPVMVAYEFSKRRYEHISALQWGKWRERLPYTGKIVNYKDSVSNICDKLNVKYNDREIMTDEMKFIEMVSKTIVEYCRTNTQELKHEEIYIPKYDSVYFGCDKRLFVFVSGRPDSGKTTFANLLSLGIVNSVSIDSDVLLEKNMVCAPLNDLIPDRVKVVVFSDVFANCFFNKKELGDAIVINVLVKPISIEKQYRNSKYRQGVPFEKYKEHELKKEAMYGTLTDSIIVTNDYSEKIYEQRDMVIDKIFERLQEPAVVEENKKEEEIIKRVLTQ